MNLFKTCLILFALALSTYTLVTISNHGWNLFPFFFGDMLSMSWAGQFNFDFIGFLFLSASWTVWRNGLNAAGIGLGVLAFFGGMLFLSLYLLYLISIHNGDLKAVLLGKKF